MSGESFKNKHIDSKQIDETINSGVVSDAVSSSQKRVHHRDKKISEKNRLEKKGKRFWDKEDAILNNHIPYNGLSNRSPHILINKWYHRLRDNCIILKSPKEIGDNKFRKIFYEIDEVGKNVKFSKRSKYMNLQLESVRQKWVMILVRFKDVMFNSKLCFFSESGLLIENENLSSNEGGYVVLAAIYKDQKLVNQKNSFDDNELLLSKRFFYNQTQGSNKEYHFRTSGTIHSFGYGAMYHRNPVTGHSIDKFSTSE